MTCLLKEKADTVPEFFSMVQNNVMVQPPDKSKTVIGKTQSAVARDFDLDPLPVPDVKESDTDTAWGLWEHTLQSYQEIANNPEDGDHVDFADTESAEPRDLQKKS